ncbi:hypothetical protein SSAmo_1320 [Enterobacterales bacterium endosymbiont of Anomoneura mori]|uniref:30S ribosomal protein S16 n=1 Tax=Enterobacterales bacterium endosymbiont of Anomoneura mori TaxID=3132096 RepID=UPI00399CD0EC
MIKIKLKKIGNKKNPFYKLIVTDKRNSCNGKFIECIGYFNPINIYKKKNINICEKRLEYWKKIGINISHRIKKIIKIFKINNINNEI